MTLLSGDVSPGFPFVEDDFEELKRIKRIKREGLPAGYQDSDSFFMEQANKESKKKEP